MIELADLVTLCRDRTIRGIAHGQSIDSLRPMLRQQGVVVAESWNRERTVFEPCRGLQLLVDGTGRIAGIMLVTAALDLPRQSDASVGAEADVMAVVAALREC